MNGINLEKGKFYTLSELRELGLEFYKKSSAVLIYKKDKKIYWFDIIDKNGKHQLLSFYEN